MKVFTTDKIRNVVLLGHSGSGKTALVEAMAYLSGLITRMGGANGVPMLSDYEKEEIDRGISISTSVVPVIWDDIKINFLDTPGSSDFIGETEEAVSAADAAVIVVSGKTGIETGTKRAWDICEKYGLPRIIFITNMDLDNASYREIVMELKDLYGKKIAPFHFPLRENGQFTGYVNVIQQKAKHWNEDGTVTKTDVPDYSMEYLNMYREILMETVAETSEEFMERYFGGDEFSEDEIRQALRVNVYDGSIIPVLMGSNTEARGMYTLLSDIIKYLPGPDKLKCAGIETDTNDVFQADYDFSKSKTAYIFKTILDPYIGKYSLIKVNSGVLKTDDVLFNYHRNTDEKIGRLYVIRANKVEEVSELHAGDIGALAKLQSSVTTDTLSTRKKPVAYIRTAIDQPYVYLRYSAENKSDEDRLSQALAKLAQEDLTIKLINDSANGQNLIYGISRKHIDVVAAKLLEKYKVAVKLDKPYIAFRETIKGNSDVEYKYKKQSGGHGQYGHVKMKFEPSGDLDTPYVFEETVVGGAVPKNYFPAVEKGLDDAVKEGPFAGYPVLGVKAVLYDGSYHAVDSSEYAFKVAAAQAFKKGFMEAKPVLLEPIAELKVSSPDEYTGDIMGDLNKRRARILNMDAAGNGNQEITAEIPYAELYGYDEQLKSITRGSGSYSYEFARYEEAPGDVAAAAKRNE